MTTDYIKLIREHLDKLHTEWENDEENDGHHKSNEGWVGYSVSLANWFESVDYANEPPEIYDVQVYSYLFGPNRLHEFKTPKEAWEHVKDWQYQQEDE